MDFGNPLMLQIKIMQMFVIYTNVYPIKKELLKIYMDA